MLSPDNVFSMLSVKDGIQNERYFVGREILLSHLNCCICGSQRSPAWIYGPRRIGKSSIARAVARTAKKEDTLMVWVDAIDIGSSGIDGVISRTVEIVKRRMFLSRKNPKESFEEIAATSHTRPVMIIFDEFDKIAINLKMDDQAFLRRLATEYDRFCYLFITCLPPENLVEEVSEVNSRILGICNMQRVMPLTLYNIQELCRRVSEDLSIPGILDHAKDIWDYTGGFTVAVMTALKHIAINFYHKNTLTDDDIKDLFSEAFDELKIDLHSYWNTLSSQTKTVLTKKANFKDFIPKLKEDGFYNRNDGFITPKFLSMGCSEDRNHTFFPGAQGKDDPLENVNILFKLVADINQSLQLKGHKDGIYIGNKTIEFYKICGRTCDETEFKESIDYLYKVFFEGARKQSGSNKEYRLPHPLNDLYKNAKIIGDISDLRNYYFHDQTRETDSEKANKNYKEAAQIFCEYCGDKNPQTNEQRILIRSSIITKLLVLLRTVSEKLKEL